MAKRIEIIEVSATTKTVEFLVCDFCGYESSGSRGVKTCVVCGRHACKSGTPCVRFDRTDHSDYPDAYCPTCYELRFVTYAGDFAAIDEEHEAKRDALWERMKGDALGAVAESGGA